MNKHIQLLGIPHGPPIHVIWTTWPWRSGQSRYIYDSYKSKQVRINRNKIYLMEKPCQNHVFQRNDPIIIIIIIIIMIIIINACTDCGPSFQNAKLSPPEVRLPVVHAGLDFAVAWACFGKKIPKQQHAGWFPQRKQGCWPTKKL